MFFCVCFNFGPVSTLIHTEGIVVKTMKYGETSVITHVFTRELGLQSFIMGGVTNGNNKSGMFQIMNQLDFVVYFQENKSMHRIKEVRYARTYQALPFEMHRTAVGVFMLELLRKCIQSDDYDHLLYDWIKNCLDYIDDTECTVTWMPLHFILGLSRHLGFQPLNNFEVNKPYFDLREGRYIEGAPYHRDYLDVECAALLHELISSEEISFVVKPDASRQTRKSLLHGMLDYYRFHLDHFKGLDSPHILEEILTT
jgi:DNA repair protein RecO (recombination protein O)